MTGCKDGETPEQAVARMAAEKAKLDRSSQYQKYQQKKRDEAYRSRYEEYNRRRGGSGSGSDSDSDSSSGSESD